MVVRRVEVCTVTEGVVGTCVVGLNTSVVGSRVSTSVSFCNTEMVEASGLLLVVIPLSVTSVKGLSVLVKPWSANSVTVNAEVLLKVDSVDSAGALGI